MASFEEKVKEACDSREISGVVLLAANKSGSFKYAKAIGPKSPTEPLSLDSTFILASCTKLMASIAALQCVERGQFGLDEDVSSVLHELKDLQIITGFDDASGEPILKKAKNKITIRHLVTHSSGIGYDGMHPLLLQWRKYKGQKPGMRGLPMIERIQLPLVFEPGTSWMYGMGLDWVGLLVSRLNKMTLEDYMQKNIWDPLGIKNITFHNDLKANVKKNLTVLSVRDGVDDPFVMMPVDTGKSVIWRDQVIFDDPVPLGDDYGGHGGIGSATDYFKILTSILLNDSKILQPKTVELMFTPQLSATAKAALIAFYETPFLQNTFASHPVGSNLDYGLAGLVTLDDEATGRRKGCLTWSGFPNLLWTIDRDAEFITFYATCMLPFGDQKTHKYQQLFEKEMYSRLGKSAKL